MVKRDNFPAKMYWKESVGNNIQPVGNVSEEDIQKLEAMKGQDMACFKSTTLEQVRK